MLTDKTYKQKINSLMALSTNALPPAVDHLGFDRARGFCHTWSIAHAIRAHHRRAHRIPILLCHRVSCRCRVSHLCWELLHRHPVPILGHGGRPLIENTMRRLASKVGGTTLCKRGHAPAHSRVLWVSRSRSRSNGLLQCMQQSPRRMFLSRPPRVRKRQR